MKTNYQLLLKAVRRTILLSPYSVARFFVRSEDMDLLYEVLENSEIQRLQHSEGVELWVFTRKARKGGKIDELD